MSHKTLLALEKHIFCAQSVGVDSDRDIAFRLRIDLERTVFDGQTMGTTYRITLTTEEPVGTGVKASLLPISIKS